MKTTRSNGARRLFVGACVAAAILCVGGQALAAAAAADPTGGAGFTQWRTERLEKLKSEDGWLTLVGLFWLKPGENHFGAAKNNAVVLSAPGVPADAGSLLLENGRLRIRPRAGVKLTIKDAPVKDQALRTDADGGPDVLRLGRLAFYVVKRGERFGVRVKDPEATTRTEFKGLEYFPYDAAARVEARFVPFDEPRELKIATAIGTQDTTKATGELHFTLHGRALTLLPFTEDSPDAGLFIVFSDATSGSTTYGAGRFLDADAPKDGKVILDFNRAYNPPCAFTHFATCPLPPRENRIPAAVEAGEKKYSAH